MDMAKYNIWKITTYFELTYDTFIIIVGIGQNDILEIINSNLMIDILLRLCPPAYGRKALESELCPLQPIHLQTNLLLYYFTIAILRYLHTTMS